MNFFKTYLLFLLITIFFCSYGQSQKELNLDVKELEIADGWANNSVNAVIFRKNSIVSFEDTQYVAFYDPDKFVVLAKRKIGSAVWKLNRTNYQGNANDAHNTISIMADGNGYLHVAWDHHNTALRYARSIEPGSLQLSDELSMMGKHEDKVTYPEFFKIPDGDLLFFYRSGESGRGNMVINYYHTKTGEWEQLQNNLIDGEDERSAYWQACVDRKGIIHVSWVWRETWDVATNHDLCYARSKDGGKTWENSKGEKYSLPITLKTAEVIHTIPQNSELINQTSMTTDSGGNPIIATYWREEGTEVPQYHVVYYDGKKWDADVVSERKTPFSLSGGGTKRIPMSRPQVLSKKVKGKEVVLMIFRDLERGNKPSVAINKTFPAGKWEISDLSKEDLGSWEPSYDTELWKQKGVLSLFVQKVEQVDGEGVSDVKPNRVKVIEWKLK